MWIFRNKPKKADEWALMSTVLTAESRLRSRGEITPSRRAGVIFRPADVPFLNHLNEELGHILHEGEGATKTAYRIEDDDHGTRWVILEDGNFRDLISSVYTVGNAMAQNGAAEQRLAAVFQFYRAGRLQARNDTGGWTPGTSGYWIFNYQRQRFYPFVPQSESERDRPAEVQMGQMMRQAGVSVDKSLEHWYALWGIPY